MMLIKLKDVFDCCSMSIHFFDNFRLDVDEPHLTIGLAINDDFRVFLSM
jgi:hypothetical protein